MKPVLLLFPPYEGQFMIESRFPFPLGLLYIAAYLKKNGIEASVMDFSYPREKSYALGLKRTPHYGWPMAKIREWLEGNLGSYHGVVGISSLMSTNYQPGYEICEVIKKISPKTKVVFGGPHATMFPMHVLANSSVDYVVLGEGEDVFLKFLQGKKAEHVLSRTEKKTSVERAFIADLDSLPFPERSLLMDGRKFDDIPVTFSRGCPHRCSFCGSHLIQGRSWRHKSVGRVIEELDWYINEWKSRSFIIEDDNICPGKEGIGWLKQVCVYILGKWGKLSFRVPHGIAVYGTADKELCDLLWKAGFRKMVFPLESSSPEVLKDMKKALTVEMFRKAAANWRPFEKHAPVEIILGYPFVDTIERMLGTIKTVADERMLVWPSHFRPNYGIELFDRCVEAGYIDRESFDPLTMTDFSVETERFKTKDLKELRQICHGVNYGTECGFNVFSDPIKSAEWNGFKFFYGGTGRLVGRGNFKFMRGQDILFALLVCRVKKEITGRPRIRIVGNDAVLERYEMSRVYPALKEVFHAKG